MNTQSTGNVDRGITRNSEENRQQGEKSPRIDSWENEGGALCSGAQCTYTFNEGEKG